jgi:hypothetical protein
MLFEFNDGAVIRGANRTRPLRQRVGVVMPGTCHFEAEKSRGVDIWSRYSNMIGRI